MNLLKIVIFCNEYEFLLPESCDIFFQLISSGYNKETFRMTVLCSRTTEPFIVHGSNQSLQYDFCFMCKEIQSRIQLTQLSTSFV